MRKLSHCCFVTMSYVYIFMLYPQSPVGLLELNKVTYLYIAHISIPDRFVLHLEQPL